MFLASIFVLCCVGFIGADVSTAGQASEPTTVPAQDVEPSTTRQASEPSTEPIDEGSTTGQTSEFTTQPIDQEIKLTVWPNKDYFGRAVIVKAEPPSNFTGFLFGPYSSVESRLVKVFFNESGFWDNPGYRGSLEPFTWYNLTINITGFKESTIEFMTDLAVPIGGVDLNFTRNETDFVEVSLSPQFRVLVYGPPTGYHVDACVAPTREVCNSYVCLDSACKLDGLQPNTNYTVNASVFNVDSFNRTLERRDYIKLYNVTTKEDLSAHSGSAWVVVGGSLFGLCGISGLGFVGLTFSKKLSTKRSANARPQTDETTEL